MKEKIISKNILWINKSSLKKAYKDGINFGYNQARKEMSNIGLALQSDMDKTIRQNLELKKENEEILKDFDGLPLPPQQFLDKNEK